MAGPSKRIKRRFRECVAAAREEELRRALHPVAEAVRRWERKELSSADLSEIIRRFDEGTARKLWARYDTVPEMALAHAITSGMLDRDTIPSEVLEHLAGPLRFYEEGETTRR